MIWERVEIAVREGQEAAFEAALCRQLGVDHFFERPGLALNGSPSNAAVRRDRETAAFSAEAGNLPRSGPAWRNRTGHVGRC
jgi:hypothetical protein